MKILESQTTVQRRNQEVSEHRGGLWKEFWKGVMVWRQFIAATLTRIFTMVLKTVFTRFSTIANGTRPHGVLSPHGRGVSSVRWITSNPTTMSTLQRWPCWAIHAWERRRCGQGRRIHDLLWSFRMTPAKAAPHCLAMRRERA